MTTIEIIQSNTITNAPKIPGLVFRGFQGEADYPDMLKVINTCMQADKIKHINSLEEIKDNYDHLVNCDPYQDMLFAEVNGQMIGYSRVFWEKLSEGIRIYNLFANLLPGLATKRDRCCHASV